MRDERLDGVEERLAQADGKAGGGALHHAAQRVTFGGCGGEELRPPRLIGAAAYLYKFCLYINAFQYFLGDDTGSDHRQGDPAGEVPAAARVVGPVPLDGGDIVGVAGAGHGVEVAVVAGTGIGIAEDNCQRGSGGVAVHYAAEDLRLVGLDAGRRADGAALAAGLGAFGARRPPGYIRGEVRLAQRHSLGHSVHHYTYGLSVGLPEDADPE